MPASARNHRGRRLPGARPLVVYLEPGAVMSSDNATSLRSADAASTRAGALAALGPLTWAVLRIGAGLLFMQHGLQKLLGWFGGFMGPPGSTAPLVSQMGVAGVLETFGGLLIVLGLFTRPVAFLLAGEMFVAYLQAHLPQGRWPILNRGELPLLYLLIYLFLIGNGAGPASLDSRRRGS
jgi:putative oxidoreductase